MRNLPFPVMSLWCAIAHRLNDTRAVWFFVNNTWINI
jgi:hypothetical protein